MSLCVQRQLRFSRVCDVLLRVGYFDHEACLAILLHRPLACGTRWNFELDEVAALSECARLITKTSREEEGPGLI